MGKARPQAFLLNPYLHPDVVVRLQEGQSLVPDRVTVANEYQVRGGAGAYTAAAMQRCGLVVAPVDHVGTDMFGDLTVAQIARLGCPTDWISRYDGPHMFVTSIADRRHLGGTMLSCCPAAWQQPAQILQGAVDALPDAEVYYVWSWFWSYANPNVSDMDVLGMMARARQRAGMLVIDPNWKPPDSPPESEVAALKEVVSSVDVLKLNSRDAAVLVSDHEPQETVKRLLKLGPAVVVLTTGPRGCLIGWADSDKQVRVPAPAMVARDTTGAGDSFGGVFVTHYLRTGDAVRAAAEAVAVAALLVSGSELADITDSSSAQLRDRALNGCEFL